MTFTKLELILRFLRFSIFFQEILEAFELYKSVVMVAPSWLLSRFQRSSTLAPWPEAVKSGMRL